MALAQGPTFDCAKAQGQVQKLICSDVSLAALDRKLDEVNKAASAKAQGKLLTQLRTEQRGWVKGVTTVGRRRAARRHDSPRAGPPAR